jgi:hypothetical protein
MSDFKLLIATGDSASAVDELPAGARALVDNADEVMVIAPALPTRLEWLASDTDKTREVADERLHTVLGQIEDTGTEVRGAVGADDPLLAIQDAVAEFKPHHILIALRSAEASGWQERGLLEQVLARFDVPVTAFRLA